MTTCWRDRSRYFSATRCTSSTLTAAFLLWAMQRVFLGNLNEKYKDYGDMNLREILCQAPLLFLCVALGIFPFYLLDWMQPSIQQLVRILGG